MKPSIQGNLICFGAVHSSKLHSLIELESECFPIVPTICFCAQIWPGLEQLHNAALWPEQFSLYVRICFDEVEYPHSFYRICTWDKLQQTVHILRSQASSLTQKPCDITIQPHLSERFGGAIASLGDILIIEAVDGNARGLLREGQINNRAILYRGELITEIFGGQQEALSWDGSGYQHQKANQIIWQDISALSAFSYSSSTLYEFCVTQMGNPLFLEKKKLPNKTFFFENDGSFTIYSAKENQTKQSFSLPALSLREQLKQDQLHVFSGGAYLSHLSFFAAVKQFPMCFLRQR